MIKLGDGLWNKLQKSGFFTNHENNEALKEIWEKQMYSTRLIRWWIKGLKFPIQ